MGFDLGFLSPTPPQAFSKPDPGFVVNPFSQFINDPNHRVLICNQKWHDRGVSALLGDPMTFAGGNTFDDPFIADIQRTFSDAMNSITQGANIAVGANFKMGQILNRRQTAGVWKSSQKFKFSLSVFLISLAPEDNILHKAVSLYSGVFPEGERKESLQVKGQGQGPELNVNIINPPMGYTLAKGAGSEVDTQGTWSVKIGSGFHANKLLMLDCSFTESKECVPNGQPLYITVNMTFESVQLLLAPQVAKFFKTSNQGGNAGVDLNDSTMWPSDE